MLYRNGDQGFFLLLIQSRADHYPCRCLEPGSSLVAASGTASPCSVPMNITCSSKIGGSLSSSLKQWGEQIYKAKLEHLTHGELIGTVITSENPYLLCLSVVGPQISFIPSTTKHRSSTWENVCSTRHIISCRYDRALI